MKKQLLTSTALVAAGVMAVSGPALANGPKLSVGGSMTQIFGTGSDSAAFEAAQLAGGDDGRVGWDVHSDAEIHFNGSVTLDNGIRIRGRVELEGNSLPDAGIGANVSNGGAAAGTSEDFIDEHWMRISGSFGELRLGSTDAAGLAMTTGAPPYMAAPAFMARASARSSSSSFASCSQSSGPNGSASSATSSGCGAVQPHGRIHIGSSTVS